MVNTGHEVVQSWESAWASKWNKLVLFERRWKKLYWECSTKSWGWRKARHSEDKVRGPHNTIILYVYTRIWLALQKPSMFACKFWSIFWTLMSRNFVMLNCNCTKFSMQDAKWPWSIFCKALSNWCNYQGVISNSVNMCKIRKHGGFSQSQLHIWIRIWNCSIQIANFNIGAHLLVFLVVYSCKKPLVICTYGDW